MSLIHMRCASVQLDTNARLSFLMPFFWEFFLVRWRCLFRFSVDGFIDFRLVCNVTSYIYGLHFLFCVVNDHHKNALRSIHVVQTLWMANSK